jgi:hypothetical protein
MNGITIEWDSLGHWNVFQNNHPLMDFPLTSHLGDPPCMETPIYPLVNIQKNCGKPPAFNR